MAKNGYGEVAFWLSMPLVELVEWIEENNRLVDEERKRRDGGYRQQKRV